MLRASMGNNTILPAKEESDYEPREFHRFFPCTKAQQPWNSGLGKRGQRQSWGRKKDQKLTAVFPLVKQHTSSTWPLEKEVCSKTCFPAQIGPPSSYYVHMSLLHFQPYLKNTKNKENIFMFNSVQCQACYQPHPIG